MNTGLRFLEWTQSFSATLNFGEHQNPESTGALREVKCAGHSDIWNPGATTQGLCLQCMLL